MGIEVPPAPSVARHPKYYRETGDVIIQIKNVLYKLDSKALCQKSGVFFTMFSLPLPPGSHEGRSEDHPVVIPGDVTPEEFDSLMIGCIDGEWSQPPEPIQRSRDLLKLTALLDCPVWAKERAIHNLLMYDMTEFPPAERIYLARRYNIPGFIEGAVRELCKKDPDNTLEKLTSNDIKQMGLSAFEVIAKVKEALQKDRRWIAFHAPRLDSGMTQDPTCSTKKHAQCEIAWKKAWWNQIGRQILQPADLISMNIPRDMEMAIEKLTASEMTPGCLASIKAQVIREGKFKTLEKASVDMGISEMLTRLEKGEL